MRTLPKTLLVFGLGSVASRFASLMKDRFDHIIGTVRSPQKAARLSQALSVETLVFDGITPSDTLYDRIDRATHMLFSIPPDEEGDPILRAIAGDMDMAERLRWVGYLSTIGVYGDHQGAWIDETTLARPTAQRSLNRLHAERQWLDFSRRTGIATQIFRLAGIYGPGNSQLEALRVGAARRIVKPDQVFNRIHVDDIAGALIAAMNRPTVGPIINLSDDKPAPPQDVVAYAAKLLGMRVPRQITFDKARMTPMARSFYSENKRVSNRLLREDLGYKLRYPTYREGLKSCLSHSASGESGIETP